MTADKRHSSMSGMNDELERWKTAQIQAAIARGVNPLDAANAMRDFLASVPAGIDPRGYVRPASSLEQDLTSRAVGNDLRAAWYGDEDVPARFKRLLDAKGTA